MALTTYTYNISSDTQNGSIIPDMLQDAVEESTISQNIIHIQTLGDQISIVFANGLTTSEISTLSTLVGNHEGTAGMSMTSGADIDYQYAYDQSSYTTTSTSYQTRMTLSSTALSGGTYVIEGTGIYNGDSTSSDTILNIFEDGVEMGKSIRTEMKDHSGNELGRSDQGLSFHFKHFRTYPANATPVFSLRHRTEINGNEASIVDISITIKRVGD